MVSTNYSKGLYGCMCIHFNPRGLKWIGMEFSDFDRNNLSEKNLRQQQR